MTRAPDRPSDHPSDHAGSIVQVRGASGSGKTSLVRSVMRELGRPGKWYVSGRKQPLYLTFEKPGRPLMVVGSYTEGVATGGVDTISEKEKPYALARWGASQGYDVLLEGIFISIEYWRTLYLQQDGFRRHDVFLNLDVDDCTEWVYRRQEAAGKERTPLKQMSDFHPRVIHTRNRLLEAGVPGDTMPVFQACLGDVDGRTSTVRSQALACVKELLGVA